MKTVEITLRRAFSMWWSFVWRMWVLMMPLLVFLMPVMYFLMPVPKQGEPPVNPAQVPHFFAKFFVVWLLFMIGMVILQTLALRWAFKTKWSDFKLIAVPTDSDQNK